MTVNGRLVVTFNEVGSAAAAGLGLVSMTRGRREEGDLGGSARARPR